MNKLIVSDASIFINFAQFNIFDKLKSLFKEIIVPEAVYYEVYQDGRYKPGSKEMLEAKHDGWIKVKKYTNEKIFNSLPDYIHDGEAEAIVLFIECDGDVLLMDDRDGQRVANNFIDKSFSLFNSFEICDFLYEEGKIKFPSMEMKMKLKQADFKPISKT